jgi:Hypothetical glycosyl hydrolase family 15
MSFRPLLTASSALLALTSLALLLGGGGGAASAQSAPAESTHFIAPTGTHEIAQAGDLSRFKYVLVNAWNHDLIAQLKAKNPGVKLLVYKDMSSSRSYACRGGVDEALLPAGVGYCFANARQPDWFTTDQAGNRIEWTPFPGHWQMDVGNPGYQDAWAENVLAELRRYRWDGVFLDNACMDCSFYFPGKRMQEYPSQASYQAATRSFLARVGPRLKAEGFLVLPGIQSHPVLATTALWADWTQFTSGGVHQYWMRWGNGVSFGGSYWLQLQETFELMQRQGKLFLTGTPADDAASMRWGRASFLLGWNGGPAGYGAGNWHPEWTVEIGTPSGPRYQVGTAWRREYTGGTAIANISDSANQTVTLGGTYLLPDGSPTSSVTLPPLSGLVLRRSGGAAAAQPDEPQSDRWHPPGARAPTPRRPVNDRFWKWPR